MVPVLTLGVLLMASAMPVNLADRVPAFDVPTFDYETLPFGNTPHDVLDALKKDGIISIDNVPSYAQVRRSYLEVAAACAVSAEEVNAEFLLHNTLKDGTKRYTISTASGQDANTTSTRTDAVCPGYQNVYNAFSSLLELVVLHVATTLDATDFTTKDGYGQTISTRKLVTDAVRLDHFHAYQATSQSERRRLSTTSATSSSKDDDYTVELHEDNGMFIVFATPAFYKVSNNGARRTFETVSASGEDDSESGLIIQTHDGRRVRPVLKPDQVTLMLGTGYNLWVQASPQLPAVMHAVRMPEVESTSKQRVLRAWFGKMTLLPSYHRMLKASMDFDMYANVTAQYVQSGHQSDHPVVGCSPGRRLVASVDGDVCNYKSCTPKRGLREPTPGCAVVCNSEHFAADVCAKSCTCTPDPACHVTMCWHTCVKDLVCQSNKQKCAAMGKACVP